MVTLVDPASAGPYSVDPASDGPLSGPSQFWSTYWIQPLYTPITGHDPANGSSQRWSLYGSSQRWST